MKEAARLLAAVFVVVAVAVAFARLQESKGYALKPGVPAPPFRLPNLSGGDADLASFGGRLVLVNFWATWCPPCVDEMPSLERLHRALGKDGLVVLGVSVDEDEAALKRFVAERGITFSVLRDPGGRRAAQAYHTTGYPETFVIDSAGILREIYVGPAQWDTPGALDHFRGLLESLSTSPTR